jgi:hypothetical protein
MHPSAGPSALETLAGTTVDHEPAAPTTLWFGSSSSPASVFTEAARRLFPWIPPTKVELTCEELRKCLPLVPRTLNEAMLSLADHNSRLLQTKLDQAFTSTYALQKLCTKVSQLAASATLALAQSAKLSRPSSSS